jgi:hypothetical protein
MNQAIAFNAGCTFEEVQEMKERPLYLKHKSGVKFQFVAEFEQPFTNKRFVKLLNLKSEKIECFMASTYKAFFKTN